MSMNGVDISSYQGGINLSTVPCDFVIVKATEGTSYINPYCNAQAGQTLNLGKKLGLYHFASGGDATAEADYFVNNIKGYLGKPLLVLDWEKEAINRGVGWAKQWLDRVQQRTGLKPLIYMSNSVVNGYDWKTVASAGYGLWNAGYYDYGTPMGYNPSAPLIGGTGAWKDAAIYQYTSEGQLAGWNGNLDLDVFYGDGKAWDAYTGAKGNTSTTQPTVPAPSYTGTPGIEFTYAVRTEDGQVLPAVTNLNDCAGIKGKRITDIAIKVNKGAIRYRVHILGGGWLPWVTGYSWSDHNNGYAGNGKPIDAVQIYYETPADYAAKWGYQKAQYRVSPVNGNYWSWQYDTETGNGQDGYGGCFGKAMDRFQLF